MATTKLYLQNQSPTYTPTGQKGAWDATTSFITKRLGTSPSGVAATRGQAETNVSAGFDQLLATFVSDPLGANYSFTASDTVAWIYGVLESNAAADMYNHIHIWVTQGDTTTTARGTLISNDIGASEWTTTATGDGDGTVNLAGTVNALAGDRIVVEIGYVAQNTVTTSRTGTINYGNQGSTDLTDGSTSVTTNPGTITFTTSTALSFLNQKKLYVANSTTPYAPATYRGAWDASGSIVDMALTQTPTGTAATKGVAETNVSAGYDVMLARFVSEKLQANYTFTASDKIEWVLGWLESNAAADMFSHIHIYVTTGSSDTVRGTLLTNNIGATELVTTAAGMGEGLFSLAGTVAALQGDRIVIEVGYVAQNTVTTSRTGTLNYGGTTTDLFAGSTNEQTEPGWFQFYTASALSLGESSPTVALNSPADAATGVSTTPALEVTGTDAEDDDVSYEIQISTAAFPTNQTTNAITLDGSTQYGSIPNWSDIDNLDSEGTVEGWFWNDPASTAYSAAFGLGDGSDSYIGMTTENGVGNTGTNFHSVYSFTNADGYAASGVFTQSTWVHVAMTFRKGRACKIIVNGAEISYNLQNTPVGTPGNLASALFYLGKSQTSGGDPNWKGKVGGFVRVWKKALSITTIAANMNTHVLSNPLLIVNLMFQEGSGTTIDNEASAGNDMSLTGSPSWTTGPTIEMPGTPVIGATSITGVLTTETFTESTSWLCPAGVTSVQVESWGGGAGGKAGAEGGGGGGGAYSKTNSITVVPGTYYGVAVGLGGPGRSWQNAPGDGYDGEDSYFDDGSQNLAKGGTGATSKTGGAGGASGSCVGDTKYSGGNGGSNDPSIATAGGGGGGAGSTGAGGVGGDGVWPTVGTGGTGTSVGGGNGGTYSGGNPVAGSTYGGGCSGTSSGAQDSAAGGSGAVKLTYTPSNTGFTNTVSGGDSDPFNSAEKISYQVQSTLASGTYYWRARGKDPTGSNAYGAWSSAWSFSTTGGGITIVSTLMMMGMGS